MCFQAVLHSETLVTQWTFVWRQGKFFKLLCDPIQIRSCTAPHLELFKVNRVDSDVLGSELYMRVWHHCCQSLNVQVMEVHLIEPKEEEPGLVHRLAVPVLVDADEQLFADLRAGVVILQFLGVKSPLPLWPISLHLSFLDELQLCSDWSAT